MSSLAGALQREIFDELFGINSFALTLPHELSGRRSSTRTLWKPHSHNAPRELVLQVPLSGRVPLAGRAVLSSRISSSSL